MNPACGKAPHSAALDAADAAPPLKERRKYPRFLRRYARVSVKVNSVSPSWLATVIFSLWLLRMVLTI